MLPALVPESLGCDLEVNESVTCDGYQQAQEWFLWMKDMLRIMFAEGWHVIQGHEPTVYADTKRMAYRFTCKLTKWSDELPECQAIGRHL